MQVEDIAVHKHTEGTGRTEKYGDAKTRVILNRVSNSTVVRYDKITSSILAVELNLYSITDITNDWGRGPVDAVVANCNRSSGGTKRCSCGITGVTTADIDTCAVQPVVDDVA